MVLELGLRWIKPSGYQEITAAKSTSGEYLLRHYVVGLVRVTARKINERHSFFDIYSYFTRENGEFLWHISNFYSLGCIQTEMFARLFRQSYSYELFDEIDGLPYHEIQNFQIHPGWFFDTRGCIALAGLTHTDYRMLVEAAEGDGHLLVKLRSEPSSI